jgi:serine/threonine-protein kinase RsbW
MTRRHSIDARSEAEALRSERDLRLSIPSRLSAIEPLCDQIRRLLEGCGLQHMQFAVELLARECLNNAILHGNQGLAKSLVKFAMRIGKRAICLRVADQGPGFDWRRQQRERLPADSAVTGRGLLVASIYAQRIVFNRPGNQVTLWIKISEGR